MSYGCFVDIQQQDGSKIRMRYDGLENEIVGLVKWFGINERMADKFKEKEQPHG